MHYHAVIDVPCDACVSLHRKVIGGVLYDIYRCTVSDKQFYVPVGKPKE